MEWKENHHQEWGKKKRRNNMYVLWAQSICTLLYMKKMKYENTQAHLQMRQQRKCGVIPIIWFIRKSKGQHVAIIPDVSKTEYLKFHLIIILSWKYGSVIQCIFKCKTTGTCSRLQSPRYWSCNLGDAFSGQFRSPPEGESTSECCLTLSFRQAHLISLKKRQFFLF